MTEIRKLITKLHELAKQKITIAEQLKKLTKKAEIEDLILIEDYCKMFSAYQETRQLEELEKLAHQKALTLAYKRIESA